METFYGFLVKKRGVSFFKRVLWMEEWIWDGWDILLNNLERGVCWVIYLRDLVLRIN